MWSASCVSDQGFKDGEGEREGKLFKKRLL